MAIPKANLVPSNPGPWEHVSFSYQEWLQNATRWLEATCKCTIPPKGVWNLKQHAKRVTKHTVYLLKLLRLQRALADVVLHAPTLEKDLAIESKVHAIKWRPWITLLPNKPEFHRQVMQEVQRYVDRKHEQLLKKWKLVARGWHASESNVFSYLRNPPLRNYHVLWSKEPLEVILQELNRLS